MIMMLRWDVEMNGHKIVMGGDSHYWRMSWISADNAIIEFGFASKQMNKLKKISLRNWARELVEEGRDDT